MLIEMRYYVENTISLKEIEKSIIKKYRKKIWAKFVKAVNDYQMVEDDDKIAVCISGGKDSLLLAKLFQELQRHGKVKFNLEFVAMDPGFRKENRQLIVDNCRYLNIPVKIFDSKIFDVVENISSEFPCYLCARMRRGALYNYAQSLGCNKIALGHHFDDVIETTILNVFYAGTFKTMLPKLKSDNYENMELIRPMVLVKEKDIILFKNNANIKAMDCACDVAAGSLASSRAEIKRLIADYKKVFIDVDKSIFSAATNVNLDAVIGYSKNGKKHSFLDEYKEEN